MTGRLIEWRGTHAPRVRLLHVRRQEDSSAHGMRSIIVRASNVHLIRVWFHSVPNDDDDNAWLSHRGELKMIRVVRTKRDAATYLM